MLIERIGILVSILGFSMLVPETLYGIIGLQKLDRMREFTLRSLRALLLLEVVRRSFKATQKSARSYSQLKYN